MLGRTLKTEICASFVTLMLELNPFFFFFFQKSAVGLTSASLVVIAGSAFNSHQQSFTFTALVALFAPTSLTLGTKTNQMLLLCFFHLLLHSVSTELLSHSCY